MYFLRIEELKAKMAVRPLSDREVLPYLVVSAALFAVRDPARQHISNIWDISQDLFCIVLAVLGSIYVYRQNGGAAGNHFLQRYFAIGWVVGIRCGVIILLATAACYGTLMTVGVKTQDTAWYDLVFLVIATTLVYWRIGHHVRDLAQRTKAA